jgi:hypothetical protein
MFELDGTGQSRIALFTFASRSKADGTEPTYALVNTFSKMKRAKDFECDAYFVRGKGNRWYFDGIDGAETIEESVEFFKQLFLRYDHVVCVGNSMGGYGALLFGLACEATHIIAFSPQTRFDREFCEAIGERRWQGEYRSLPQYQSLEEMTARAMLDRNSKTRIDIYVGERQPEDVAYVREIEYYPNVTTHYMPSDHNLVYELRKSGELERIIYESLQKGQQQAVGGAI